MAKNITIPFDKPLEGHDGMVTGITIRPPTWSDVMGVGSPYTVHFDKENSPFIVYDEAALAHYCEVLVVEPKQMLAIESEIELKTTLEVREKIVNFFLVAAGAAGGSKTSPKNSSSNSDGNQTQLAA